MDKHLHLQNFIEKLPPPLFIYYFKPYHNNKRGLFVKTSPKYEKHQETRSSPKTLLVTKASRILFPIFQLKLHPRCNRRTASLLK